MDAGGHRDAASSNCKRCILDLLRKPDEVPLRQHVSAIADVAARHTVQAVLTLAFLPYESTVHLDAIARTAWRMLVTHRGLLEWNPSAGDEPDARGVDDMPQRSALASSIRSMWIAPVIGAAAAILLTVLAPSALVAAAPILLLWFVSPGIAWWISRPLARREARLTMDQTVFLRKLARRTWGFFETLVGPDDHWLPPDNVQEQPVASLAHRTSPTNMGLALLANLAAYDFGYVAAGQLIARTANSLRTMESLERYEGHFYNWYDTQSLKPQLPLYVSAVDSGNLAGHLMTLRAGLLGLADARILEARWFEGLGDTLRILVDTVGGTVPSSLVHLQRDLDTAYDSRLATVAEARQWLDRLDAGVAEVAVNSPGLPTADSASESAAVSETIFWTDALVRQCRAMQDELAFLVAVDRAAGGAERTRRPRGQSRDPDVARARGIRRGVAAGDRAPTARGRVADGARVARRIGPRGQRRERFAPPSG